MSTDYSKPRIQRLCEGLQLIFKADSGADVSSEHDVIYAGSSEIEFSDEDKVALDRLGWFIDDRAESWGFFT